MLVNTQMLVDSWVKYGFFLIQISFCYGKRWKNMEKYDKMLKKMIWTSKRHAKLPFAGQNTQQIRALKAAFCLYS